MNQIMDFNVIFRDSKEDVTNWSKFLKEFFGFEIFDLREADIVDDKNNSKIDKVYILCCRGSKNRYLVLKTFFKHEETEYEGKPSLM